MPIEIKELHLRMVVNTPPAKQAPAVQDKAGASGTGDSGDRGAIVAECVEQVLQIMQTKKER